MNVALAYVKPDVRRLAQSLKQLVYVLGNSAGVRSVSRIHQRLVQVSLLTLQVPYSVSETDKRLAQSFLPTLQAYSVNGTDKRSAQSFLQTLQVYVQY